MIVGSVTLLNVAALPSLDVSFVNIATVVGVPVFGAVNVSKVATG